MTQLTSREGKIEFGLGLPTLLINDQLRIIDPPGGGIQSNELVSQLRNGELDSFMEIARRGKLTGMDAVDILIDHPDLDEADILPIIAEAVHQEIGCPISLDSRNPVALERALKALQPYKVMVNSISAEREVLDELLPMAREFGAVIVGMPVGRGGLSRTMEERLDLTAEIIISAEKSGIPREDIVIDAICLASAVEPGSMQVTFEVLRAIHNRWGVTTILGIGNAGYGMPKPTWIDLSYLLAAIPWGLDAALANPETPGLVQAVRAADFLTGNDRAGKRYIRYCRKGI